jgi:hypothetical protein
MVASPDARSCPRRSDHAGLRAISHRTIRGRSRVGDDRCGGAGHVRGRNAERRELFTEGPISSRCGRSAPGLLRVVREDQELYKRALVRIVGGALDDATRATLDEAMRSGDFREVEERPWTPTGTPLELASFRVVTEGETIRIEHSGHSIFERTSKSIPRFTPTCEARVRPAGEDVVVERRCRVMDEGIEVIEMDVYGCDERACK